MTEKQAKKIANAIASNLLFNFDVNSITSLSGEEREMLRSVIPEVSLDITNINLSTPDQIVDFVLKRRKFAAHRMDNLVLAKEYAELCKTNYYTIRQKAIDGELKLISKKIGNKVAYFVDVSIYPPHPIKTVEGYYEDPQYVPSAVNVAVESIEVGDQYVVYINEKLSLIGKVKEVNESFGLITLVTEDGRTRTVHTSALKNVNTSNV